MRTLLSTIIQDRPCKAFPLNICYGIITISLLVVLIVMGMCVACASSTAPEMTGDEYSSSETDMGTPYLEIRENYVSMQEAEWESYVETLIGEEVQWTGQVHVVEGAAAHMWVKVDMNPETSWDVTFQIASQIALKMRPGRTVKFEGEIDDVVETTEGGEPSVKVWLQDVEVME